jgi:hypothetical protein
MRRIIFFFTSLFLAASFYGQPIVTRNVHLREQPTTASRSLRVLAPQEEVELLGPTTNGFLHVQTEDGTQGWAYAHFLRTPPPAETLLPSAAPADAALAIDDTWEKPAPITGTFTLNAKTCGPTGSGSKRDKDSNRRKNRTDIPREYHTVTWQAIATLAYPASPRSREDFTAEQLAMIAKYEGVAVQTVGYIVAIKPQASNTESCNCAWKGESATDWHIALVEHPGDGEKTSIVVEPTPRIKKHHPKWKPKNLTPWLNNDLPVRISGWLLFDPQHTNDLKKYRSTLWEIHPITKIEVWDAEIEAWKNLDD